MPAFNSKSHVSDYGGTARKEKREPHVLDEFCKRIRRCHGASFKAIRDPLNRGLVLKVEGETVDGVLNTARGLIAVELLGYSPREDRGDVMDRDVALRKVVKQALYDQLRARCYSLLLGYREQRRPGPKFATARTVPRDKDFCTVVNELQSAVVEASAMNFNSFLWLEFVNPELASRLGRRSDTLYLDATRFPVCAAHLDHVRLQVLAEYSPPQVDSNLGGGMVGLDSDFVREHLAKKAERSLRQSKKRANGLPLWLIVHSDGNAIHQTIPKVHRKVAVELCRDTLANLNHGFSRVYWADRTAFLDAAWVGRVL